MGEPVQMPEAFRPIEPETPEDMRQIHVQRFASATNETLTPLSATHTRPPLPD